MYAIVETGGKQYRVKPGDTIAVERLSGEPGEELELGRVLLVAGNGDTSTRVGSPAVAGAVVRAEVVEHGRGEKIIVFRYKSKVRYRRKTGHRQSLTRVRITDILLDGASTSKRVAASEPAPAEAEPIAIATAEADPLVASEAAPVVERAASPDPIPMTSDDVEATSAGAAEEPPMTPDTNQA
jgi:large subunit ribosomal protein L21